MIYKHLFVINVIYVLMMVNAKSAEHHFMPGIGLSTIYTDNVDLQQEGNEQSDIIYEVSPQFIYNADGKRMDVSAAYNLQILEYDKTDGDRKNHQLNANANIEVLQDNMFIDAYVRRNQSYIDYDKAISQDNYTITENRTDVTTYRITPKLRTRLGGETSLEASKTFSRVEYDAQGRNKLEKENSRASIKSGFLGGDVTLGINYINNKDKSTNYDDTQQFLSINYSLAPTISVFGEIGKEYTNRITTLASNDSSYYRAGVKWVPNNRSQIEATHGERVLGRTSSLDAKFTSRTNKIELKYDKDITSSVDIYSKQNYTGEADQSVDLYQTGLNRRLFIREKYQVFLTKNTSKTTFAIKYYKENRNYEDESFNEKLNGHNFNWLWQISAKTSFTFVFAGSKRTNQLTRQENTTETITLSITKNLGGSGKASLGYSKFNQDFMDGLIRYETKTVIFRVFLPF